MICDHVFILRVVRILGRSYLLKAYIKGTINYERVHLKCDLATHWWVSAFISQSMFISLFITFCYLFQGAIFLFFAGRVEEIKGNINEVSEHLWTAGWE